MFNLFFVKDFNNKRKLMSAKKLSRLVSNSCYSGDDTWLYNAKNLIKVCNKKSFPSEYKDRIESTLMNHYSMLLYCNDSSLKSNKHNLKCICKLYNALSESESDIIIDSRDLFLNSYLEYITNLFKKNYKNDHNFNLIAETWRKRKFNKYFKKSEFDFYGSKPKLTESFGSLVSFLGDASILTGSISNKYDYNSEKNTNFKKEEKIKNKKLVKTR